MFVTATGVLAYEYVWLPSWPAPFAPQQYSAPDLIAQV
jgi:hypothetical protein